MHNMESPSKSALVSFEPATGIPFWEGPLGNVSSAATAARAAYGAWSRTSLARRVAIAEAFAEIIRVRADTFARLIARETGKPFWEARTEVASVIGKIAISVMSQLERAGERTGEVAGATQRVRHKPHGVLAVLGPYNFPAHLPNGHIAPALLAGNCVLFKPSELTPAVGEYMGQCWRDAGLPDGVLSVIQGDGAIGKELAAHPEIDGLLFTGSESTGVALHRQFGGRPDKMLALEMGGNNPLVVWNVEPADVEGAAAMIVQSAFATAGQRCTCARRLIVEEGRHSALIEALVGLMDRLIVGAPFDDPAPFMGPVIDNRAADRLLACTASLEAKDATAIRPLRRVEQKLPFLSPALYDVTHVATSDEEFFGPLLQVQRVASFEAAIAAANATRFGLAAGLIGGDRALYDRFWQETRAGIVNWNRPTTGAASNAPFGGVGYSGNHRPSAYYAADYTAWPVASLEAEMATSAPFAGVREKVA